MKKGNLIIICVLVLAIAVLATLLFRAWYSESEAMRNTAAAVAASYEKYSKDARTKTDDYVRILSENVKEPGMFEKYQPYYEKMFRSGQ